MSQFQQYNVNDSLTSVDVVSTTNISGIYFNGDLNNGINATLNVTSVPLIIDGVTIVAGMSILLSGQTNANQNGIYLCQEVGSVTTTLQRRPDFQFIEQIRAGQYFTIAQGVDNGGTFSVVESPVPNILGVDPINFVFSVTPSFNEVTSNPSANLNAFSASMSSTVSRSSNSINAIVGTTNLVGSNNTATDSGGNFIVNLGTGNYTSNAQGYGVKGQLFIPGGATANVNGYQCSPVAGYITASGSLIVTSLSNMSLFAGFNQTGGPIGSIFNLLGDANNFFVGNSVTNSYYLNAGTSAGSAGDPAHCAAQKVLVCSINSSHIYIPAFTQNT